ncbi:MAG: enoyl-CoA hydratase-related protein, partial [Burkholderiales bacterium]
GIFVGGGAAVRVPRLIGVARMMDMMMTGRVYGAEEGERVGLSQYLVGAGESLPKAIELAHKVARNAPMTNFALINALPLIAEASPDMGYLGEAMVSAIAQAEPEAKARLESFLAKREPKVGGER